MKMLTAVCALQVTDMSNAQLAKYKEHLQQETCQQQMRNKYHSTT